MAWTKVTDPKIIEELESQYSNPKQDNFAQQQQLQQPQQMQQQPIGNNQQQGRFKNPIENFAANSLGSILNGITDTTYGARDLPYTFMKQYLAPGKAEEIAKKHPLLAPRMRPNYKQEQGTLNDILRNAGSAIPEAMIAPLLMAGGVPATAAAIGSGAFGGAALAKEDPAIGAILGGVLGAAPMLPKIFNAGGTAKKIANISSPENINKVKEPIKQGFIKLFEKTKGDKLYGNESKSKGLDVIKDLAERHDINKIPEELSYLDLDPEQIKTAFKSSDARKMHNILMENKSPENAHWLQSQLGKEISELYAKKNVVKSLEPAEEAHLKSYEFAKKLIDRDIKKYFDTKGKRLAPEYQELRKQFREKVAPIRNLASIVEKHLFPGEEIDKNSLNRALRSASSIQAQHKLPFNKEILNMGKLLHNQMRNQKVARGLTGFNQLKKLIGA